eukprot:TRINITY_DN2888_c0_g1_i1.p1 TRINITY_DN2888_c0_g1~~TRINITY_DN2888_c0_g1_i1.p1  ORF type:complete len:801 (-),score=296.84 TRINITY_DN2888_c0_g1_i1:108-2510(-)
MLAGLRFEGKKEEKKSKKEKKAEKRKEAKKRKREKEKEKKKSKKAAKKSSSSSSSSEADAAGNGKVAIPPPVAGTGASRLSPVRTCPSGGGDAEAAAAKQAPQSEAEAPDVDFFSSLGTVHKKDDKAKRPDPEAKVVSERELNPLLHGKETEQPAAKSVSSIPSHLKVGDGGSTWRKRMQSRVKQAEDACLKGEELKPLKDFGGEVPEEGKIAWGGNRGKKAGKEDKSFVEQQIARMQLDKRKAEKLEQEKQEKLEQQREILERRKEEEEARNRGGGSRGGSRSRDRSRSGSRRRRQRHRSRSGSGSGSRGRRRRGEGGRAVDAASWRRRQEERRDKLAAEAEEEVDDVLAKMQSKYGGGSKSSTAPVEPASRGAAGAGAAAAEEEEEDANSLGAKAMQAMLSGDMELYEQLNKRLEKKQAGMATAGGANPVKTQVLEELDAQGRSRALMESVHTASCETKGRNKRGTVNTGTSKGGKDEGFFKDDNVSLDDLIRREKVQGVADYDKNFADHIMRTKRFKQLHDDEDEANALGWYEGVNNKLDAKKREERQRKQEVRDKQRIQKNLENCTRCMESKKFRGQDAVLSASPRAYVCADSFNSSILPGQVFISPTEHVSAGTDLDESTWTEIRNYQKCLVSYYESLDPPKAPIFAETSIHNVSRENALIGGGPHVAIIVYPVDVTTLQDARIYFKKALDEAECEWSTQHKKVIATDAKTGARRAIPKNFPYIHVDFSLGGGYAHVVDDIQEFPKDFIQHTVAGMCELTVLDRAYTAKEDYWDAVREMKERFSKEFDWAAKLAS